MLIAEQSQRSRVVWVDLQRSLKRHLRLRGAPAPAVQRAQCEPDRGARRIKPEGTLKGPFGLIRETEPLQPSTDRSVRDPASVVASSEGEQSKCTIGMVAGSQPLLEPFGCKAQAARAERAPGFRPAAQCSGGVSE